MDLSTYFSAEFLLSFITLGNILGAIGGLLYIAAISMRTVIPLRIAGIASAFFFLCSGIFLHSFPTIFLYSLLMPVNSYRLYQMIELIKRVRAAASGDLSMNWLEPFMTRRKCRKGDVLFQKGDLADEMFLAVKGKYLVSELNIELRPGQIFGELGLVTSGSQRTQTIECIESGHVLTINYDRVRELYFENPEFGFYQKTAGRDHAIGVAQAASKKDHQMFVKLRMFVCETVKVTVTDKTQLGILNCGHRRRSGSLIDF